MKRERIAKFSLCLAAAFIIAAFALPSFIYRCGRRYEPAAGADPKDLYPSAQACFTDSAPPESGSEDAAEEPGQRPAPSPGGPGGISPPPPALSAQAYQGTGLADGAGDLLSPLPEAEAGAPGGNRLEKCDD